MLSSKKITCKGKDLCGRCLSVRGPLPTQVFVWGGLEILQVLNLVRYTAECYTSAEYGLLWSLTGFNTPHHPSQPHSVTYILYFDTGKGEVNQRERYRRNNSQSWVENTNMTDRISNKHLPQSPFTGQFVQMTTFSFSVFIVNQSMELEDAVLAIITKTTLCSLLTIIFLR